MGALYLHPKFCSARGRAARAAKCNCEQIVNFLFQLFEQTMNGSRPIIHILFTKSS